MHYSFISGFENRGCGAFEGASQGLTRYRDAAASGPSNTGADPGGGPALYKRAEQETEFPLTLTEKAAPHRRDTNKKT
jgi:hypothetical protein